jgi:peptidoglycan/LPS O-acetylase OafA/YrhL
MKTNGSIKSIQLLRATAALAVVYTHYSVYAFPQFHTGGFGVDIFFIISGFIIAFIVSNNTRNFLKKRLIRVVPMYILATMMTIGTALVFPQWFNNIKITVPAVVKSILFIPYKIGDSGPILSLGWTLNNEIFFI